MALTCELNHQVIAKPCTDWAFCTSICPTGAIEADEWLKAMSVDVQWIMQEDFLPRLSKAEEEGHFCRLVPVKDIGFNTPVYKVHNKHPRWIIGRGLQ